MSVQNHDENSFQQSEVWRIEVEMLQQLLSVCEQNGLRCYADGGTLLGAVRHNGFIPWDDDIDMVLMREDYDKLMQIGPTAFHAPIFFQSYETDTEYFRSHIQLRYDGTTAMLPDEAQYVKFHQGIFIDIFPLDGVPENRLQCRAQWFSVRFWKRLMSLFYNRRNGRSKWKDIISRMGYAVGRHVNIIRLQRRMHAACARYEGSPTVTLLSLNPCINRNLLQREWFQETKYLPFQNVMIPVPAEYDKVLTVKYGKDYMTPSQENSMHGHVIFDTDRNYKEYIAKGILEEDVL